MRKYSSSSGPHAPTVFFALPELVYPEQLNAVRTLLDAIDANSWGERTALVFRGIHISYAELRREVHRYAAVLRRLDIHEGDSVLIRIDDRPELIFSILAVQAIGAVAVPTYPQLRTADLVYRADDAQTKVALVGDNLLTEADPLPERSQCLKRVIVVPGDAPGRHQSLSDLLAAGEVPGENGEPFEYANTHRDELALILYTSGSTGKSKGTCHNHADLLAVCDTYCRYCVGLRPDDVIGGPVSVSFALGYGMYALFPFRFGASALMEPDKAPDVLLPLLREHRVTVLAAVPTYYNVLARALQDSGEKLPDLRMSLVGGEPLLAEVEQRWEAATNLPLEQFLGTTELLHIFLSTRHGIDKPKRGAIGVAVPGYEVSVRDPETFEPVADGTHGMLCVRGPTGTCYLNRPEAQAEAVRDGWNLFQDTVWRDAEGYIHYVARKDDVINSGGYTISPVDVESVLMRHPKVLECGCVAAPDPDGNRSSIVKAFVALREGEPDAAMRKALQDYFKSEAPPYMYPREIVFMKELPKTINGKILRSELRKL